MVRRVPSLALRPSLGRRKETSARVFSIEGYAARQNIASPQASVIVCIVEQPVRIAQLRIAPIALCCMETLVDRNRKRRYRLAVRGERAREDAACGKVRIA